MYSSWYHIRKAKHLCLVMFMLAFFFFFSKLTKKWCTTKQWNRNRYFYFNVCLLLRVLVAVCRYSIYNSLLCMCSAVFWLAMEREYCFTSYNCHDGKFYAKYFNRNKNSVDVFYSNYFSVRIICLRFCNDKSTLNK